MATITGDIVQARNLQRTYNQVNKFVGVGFEIASIGVATMINPVLGGFGIVRQWREAHSNGNSNRAKQRYD